MKKCDWADKSEIEKIYHDEEWGVPVYDDRKLFENLVLEMKQAGLSWLTILKKREAIREAFDGFDYYKISKYDENKIEELLKNDKIIRHRLKIEAIINNAKKFIEIEEEYGGFNKFIWAYVDNKTIINNYKDISEIPSKTALSEKISKDLKKKGFKFIGPTTIYSFIQAIGMVDDHMDFCFKKKVK